MSVQLPEHFCWSKMGAEAGETVDDILDRKESARAADGPFLWGIGQQVGPAVRALVERVAVPELRFTDMLGKPKLIDATPTSTVLWRQGVGLDDAPFVLPPHSLVTSRGDRATHWALVCASDDPINAQEPGPTFKKAEVRNIVSGKVPADQQITTTVTWAPDPSAPGRTYEVRVQARLVAPYVVTLTDPVVVPVELRNKLSAGDLEAMVALERLAHH